MQIQDVMVEYFRKRKGPMARDGISALQKSLAAIYYLPFQCGVNLYFRFSGVQLCLVRSAALHPCLAAGLGWYPIRLPLTCLTHPVMTICPLEGRLERLRQKWSPQCRAIHTQQVRGET